jgi:hypothetical protein
MKKKKIKKLKSHQKTSPETDISLTTTKTNKTKNPHILTMPPIPRSLSTPSNPEASEY